MTPPASRGRAGTDIQEGGRKTTPQWLYCTASLTVGTSLIPQGVTSSPSCENGKEGAPEEGGRGLNTEKVSTAQGYEQSNHGPFEPFGGPSGS